jgi:hypothetical protein
MTTGYTKVSFLTVITVDAPCLRIEMDERGQFFTIDKMR